MAVDILLPEPHEVALYKIMQVPLKRDTGFQITISRYFTDVNGNLIDKNLAPAGLQVEFPFWLFGQFDRAGGYKLGNKISPPNPTSFYVGSFVGGFGQPILFATGLNTIQNKIQIGDLVHVFTDDLNAPSTYVFVVQTCNSASVVSIYNNATTSESQKIYVEGINYLAFANTTPNFQWVRAISRTKMDVLGQYTTKPFPPLDYRSPDDKQNIMVKIPLKFTVNQYIMLSSYIDFNLDNIELSLILKRNLLNN